MGEVAFAAPILPGKLETFKPKSTEGMTMQQRNGR